MAIITLTTDWGTKDPYVGATKGSILQLLPEANIIDISHEIEPFNLNEVAFVLKNVFPRFPKGTVHIIGVSSEETPDQPHTAVLFKDQYFIGTDTGIFSMLFNEPYTNAIQIETKEDSHLTSFATMDRFVKSAVHLVKGNPMEALGRERERVNSAMLAQPIVNEDFIRGEVIYVDNYENLITNISKKVIDQASRGRKFNIHYQRNVINGISENYCSTHEGEIVGVYGFHGYLEIAINKGNAQGLLGGGVNEKILIEFL